MSLRSHVFDRDNKARLASEKKAKKPKVEEPKVEETKEE